MKSKKQPKNESKDKLKNAVNKLSQMVLKSKHHILEGELTQAHDELYTFITEQKDTLGGDDSILLLPGLFVIAQIHILQGQIKKAQQYLNGAHWSFLKNNDRTHKQTLIPTIQQCAFQSRQKQYYSILLHRIFAKLYLAKNNFEEAINSLKTSVNPYLYRLIQCNKWGPEHPYLGLNYFLFGKIFLQSGKQGIGESFFSKVAQIWYRYLDNFISKNHQQQESFLIEQIDLQEAINYLAFIQKHFQQVYQEQQLGIVCIPIMRVYYSIGLLYKIFGDNEHSAKYLRNAYKVCLKYLPENDKRTEDMGEVLHSMNVDLDKEDTVELKNDQ